MSDLNGSPLPLVVFSATSNGNGRGGVPPRSAHPRFGGQSFHAPVAHPPQEFIKDIGDWAMKRKVGVSKCDSYIVDPLDCLGVVSHLFDTGTHNPHAFSAACREAALQQVLGKAGKGKTEMNAWDVFGSPRTRAFDPSISGPFLKVRQADGTVFSSRRMKVSWFSGPDTPIQGDAARGACVRSGDGLDFYDLVVCIDIYQSGSTSATAFSPEFARELLAKTKDGVIYWVGRFFNGIAGSDEPIEVNEKRSIVEQMFVKNSDGHVLSSSDGESGAYAPHPWPEWLCQRTFQGLDIAPVSKVGPYHIVRIGVTRYDAITIAPIPVPDGECVLMELDYTSYMFHLIPVYGTKIVEVVLEVFLKVHPKLVRKIPNGQLLDMAQVQVEKEFSMHRWLPFLRRRFPRKYQTLLSGTVLACVYEGRHADSVRLALLRTAAVSSETSLSSARRADNKFTAPWHRSVVAGIGLGVATSVAVMSRRMTAGAWIVPQHPILSALIEEGLACISEPLAVCGYLFEFWTSTEDSKPYRRLSMHVFCSTLRIWGGVTGRCGALILHLGWNWRASTLGSRFAQFFGVFAEGGLIETGSGITEPIPEGTVLPSYTAVMTTGPENFRGNLVLSVDRVSVSIEEAFMLLGRPVGRNVIHPILITQRLLQQPANNETNLLAAALFRLHNDPFVGNEYLEEQRHANWEKLGNIFIDTLLGDLRCAVYSVGDNIRAMGKKGQRLLVAYDENMLGRTLFSRKTVNLKWNETITSQKAVNGVLTMKPRAIQNLPALTHALMGGYARSFSKELHDLFDGRVHDVAGHPVRIFFASGYDQEGLSEIGRAAACGHTVFAMSGDDSFVAWGGILPEFGGEADQSQFDHTQDDGPMKRFMRPVLLRFGFPEEFIDMAYGACSSGYTMNKGRLAAKGEAGTQMPTGITTTTSFNSMSTLAMFVWFMHNRKHIPDLVVAGSQLGFNVKYFPRSSVTLATFLKGWWMHGPEGLQWMPLPSACLKIGKLLNDPVTITRVTRRGKKHYLPRSEAIRQCSTAMAQSYGIVDDTYPILGKFLFTMSRLGKQPRKELGALQESWKPRMSGIRVSRECALDSLLMRYGINREEVEEVERLLDSVVSLPSYVEHVVFDKLCNVDY